MNHMYRLVFNRAKGIIQVASEFGSNGGKASTAGGANSGAPKCRRLRKQTSLTPIAAAITLSLGLSATIWSGTATGATVFTGTTDYTWGTATNWTPNTVPNASGVIADVGTGSVFTVDLGTNTYTIGGLTIESGSTVQNGTLDLNNGGSTATITASGTGNSISANLSLTDPTSITANSGAALDISGVISGASHLNLTGAGTITLSGANTFSSNVTINGHVVLGNASALGSGGAFLNLGQGVWNASLDLGGNTVNESQIGAANGATISNGTISTSVATVLGTSTISANIAGAGIVQQQTGTGTLSGNNTYTGNTELKGGTLRVSSNANLGSTGNSIVFTGGTLEATGSFTSNRAVSLSTADGNFNVDSGQTLTLGGVIDDRAGSYAVNKSGAGTLVLTQVNTYDGGTTVTGGTLNVNTDGALGNTSGGLTLDGGTLQWGSGFNSARSITLNAVGGIFDSNTYNVTLSGGVTGSGSLNKQGTGILTLSGANTYTGDTVVNGGTLKTSGTGTLGSNSGAVIVNNGSVLDLGTLTQTQNGWVTLTSGTIQNGTLNSSGMFVLGNGTVSAALGGTGAVFKNTTGTVTLSGASTYTGTTTVSAGTLNVTNASALGDTAGGTVVQNGATLELSGSSGSYTTISNEALTLNGAGVGGTSGALYSASGAYQWTGPITLGSDSTIKSDSSPLLISGTIDNGGHLLTTAGSGYLYLYGSITGSGGLTTSSNLALMIGNNNYTGTTTVQSGKLSIGGGNAIADTGAVVVNNGGTLEIRDSETIGSLSGNAGSVLQAGLANNVTLTTGGNGASTTFAGAIQDNSLSGTVLSLTKSGNGTLTLTGANTYTGGTMVSAGTLVGNTTSLQGNITDNAALQFSQGSNGTFAGVVSGTGSVTKTGAGTVTLSGANTYTGTTKVSAGTLAAGTAGAFSTNSATTINTGATLDLGGFTQTVNSVALAGGMLTNGSLTGAITSSGGVVSNITGAPTMVTTGGSTTTLSGTNAFGNITNTGTLINNGVGSDDLSNSGLFTNNATWTANIASNSGTINNVSTGTWNNDVLSGANVAGGQITNQGTWNGTTSYNNGGILNNAGTWNGAIINTAGTFINTGTLGGNLTNVAGATAVLGSSGIINGNVSNSGTLITNGSYGVMQVNGNYTQGSTGTLTIGVTPNASSGPGVGYDQLNVSGNAALAGALAVQVGSGTYTLGTKYDIVHAGAVTGQFDTVSYEPSFASYISPQLSYTGTDAYLTLNPTQTAFNSGQAVNIDGWATQLGLLNMQQGLLNVQGGTTGGILRVNQQPDPGVWVRYLGGSGSSDGARLNNQGMLLGYGTEVRDGLVLGGAFTQNQDRTETDVQSVKTKATGLAVYGLYNHGDWFVDSAISGGHLHTDSNRTLQPTGLVASGNADGNYAGFLTKAGYRINRDRLFLTPYALVGYQYTHRNSFSETGAGLLNMTYAGQTSNLSIFGAGTRIGTDWRIKDNLTLSPWIDLGAITYGGDRDQQQTVTLGTVDQVLQASGAPSVAGVVNAGVALMSSDNWSAQLAYRGQFGSHTHMNTADLKVVYRW